MGGMGSMIRFLFLVLVSSALATFVLADHKKHYVVYLGGHSHGRDAPISLADREAATASHHELLGTLLGSKLKAEEAIFYSYNRYINGFAAKLADEEANQISNHPGVVSVFPDKLIPLHTTRSWDFLSLEEDNGSVPPASAWWKTRYGDDVIIGNIDTGVWPESRSFDDSGMGPVPARWRGSCQNNTKDGVPCNKKLIGAKFFSDGYETYNSTRDTVGHGTHTLSTAGGSFVKDASTFGFANGTAKGGSPGARVAAYKACTGRGCTFSNIIAAVDEAIYDGVDVLSLSIGGNPTVPFSLDGLAISTFHAVKQGVVVVASAGNNGPHSSTVSNTAPWLFTVAASTMDRDFPVDVYLGDIKHNGSTRLLVGQGITSMSLPEKKSYPLIAGEDAAADPNNEAIKTIAAFCWNETALDSEKVRGKIVVCLEGYNGRMEKGLVARRAGAVGMLLVNGGMGGNDVQPENHFLPAAHLSEEQARIVGSYIYNTRSPLAYISPSRTRINLKPAPVMADFSSRGPNYLNPEILKPDVTAPGMWVLAAYPSNKSPSGLEIDGRRMNYSLLSGTSMACPHVAGVVGLIKSKYPHWSPAAIRSAIMTTATTNDNTGKPMRTQNLTAKATPFDYGAGHVQPNKAIDPGLVYDLTTEDYLNFLCSNNFSSAQISLINDGPYSCPSNGASLVSDVNYPSITIVGLENSTKVATRTLKNVGKPATYDVLVRSPEGVHVTVKPSRLYFSRYGEEKRFELAFTPAGGHFPKAKHAYGEIVWSDGRKHRVRSPLVVQGTQ